MLFDTEIILLIAAITFFAALVHGSIGFAFPMIATSLLALFFDLQSAILLTLVPTLLVNIVSIASEADFKLANFIDAFKRHSRLALYALFGSAIGTFLLISLNFEWFKIVLALAILLYLFSNKLKLELSWVRTKPVFSKAFFGLMGGLLGGLSNVMMPFLVIYSIESKHSKRDIIQSANICFLTGKIIQIIMFTVSGKFTLNTLSISWILLFATAIALMIGIQIKKRIKPEAYIQLLRGLLFILAMILIITTLL